MSEGEETVTRKVVREVQVPYTRQVRVPVTNKRIVTKSEKVRIPSHRLREVTTSVRVPEEEVDFVGDNVRKWAATKRQTGKSVTVGVKDIEPYVDEVEVEVPRDVVEEVVDYRLDTVRDLKVVEVEEEETYKIIKKKVGNNKVTRTKEVGAVRKRDGGPGHIERVVGDKTYTREELDDFSSDSDPDETAGIPFGESITTRTLANTAAIRKAGIEAEAALRASVTPSRNSSRRIRPPSELGMLGATSSSSKKKTGKMGDTGLNSTRPRPLSRSARPPSRGGDPFAAANSPRRHNQQQQQQQQQYRPGSATMRSGAAGASVGVVIRDAEGRRGCRVTRIIDRSPAFHAGIKINDIITDVDNINTPDVPSFKAAVSRAGALLHISVKRAGTVLTFRTLRPNY